MSRWCDQSIHDERNPHLPVALYEVAHLFGTLVAETILASVHVRAHKQAGHMDASDLIKALPNTLQGGGRPHMENRAASSQLARSAASDDRQGNGSRARKLTGSFRLSRCVRGS